MKPETDSPKPSTTVDISTTTLLKIPLIAGLLYILYILAPVLMTIFLAAMVAVTLHPVIAFFRRRHLPDWVGISLVALGFFIVAGLIVGLIMPQLIDQTSVMIDNLPQIRNTVLTDLPPFMRSMGDKLLSDGHMPDPSSFVTPLLSAGQIAVGGMAQTFLIVIFSIYLLIGGPASINWILAFFSRDNRQKLRQTADEISEVVAAYVAGQMITSLICGLFAFIILSILKVPAALMLGTLAGIFDILPILGFFLAAIPAVLLALTVSPLTALMVTGLYIVYHAFESYVLIPRVYGSRMRLSGLVVLISLLAAGALGGILGAVAILPVVASYPIIERIWLVSYLGNRVINRHARIENEKASEQLP